MCVRAFATLVLVCSTEGRIWTEAAEGSNWVEGGGSRKLHNALRPSNVIGEGGSVEGSLVPSQCLHEWKSAAELLVFKCILTYLITYVLTYLLTYSMQQSPT
jgi:hypothetical protein